MFRRRFSRQIFRRNKPRKSAKLWRLSRKAAAERRREFSPMFVAAGIRTGGKTGTAEKLAPVYDEKTGKLKTITKKRKDEDGELVEYKVP